MQPKLRSRKFLPFCLPIFGALVSSMPLHGADVGNGTNQENRELLTAMRALSAQNSILQKQLDEQQKQLNDLKLKLAAGKPAAPVKKAASTRKAAAETTGGSTATTSAPTPGASSASGDGKTTVDTHEKAKDDTLLSQIDAAFDVPDSPSAAILDVAPQKVTRPSTPQQIIGTVISAVDEHGNFQAGVAIDVAPYEIVNSGLVGRTFSDRNDPKAAPDASRHAPVTKSDQQAHEDLDPGKYLLRLAQRTQLSLATTKGTEDADKSTRIAFGIQTTLMNETDPLYRAGLLGAQRAAQTLGLNFDEAQHANSWHYNSSWSVGAAQVIIARDGSSGNFRAGATGVYTTYAYGFEGIDHLVSDRVGRTIQSHGQLLLDARYLDHDIIVDPAKTGSFMPENSVRGSLRLRMGYPDINFGIIETVTHEWLSNRENTSYETDAAVELRLPGAGAWLTASAGKEFGRSDGKSPVVVLGGVKIGYSKNP